MTLSHRPRVAERRMECGLVDDYRKPPPKMTEGRPTCPVCRRAWRRDLLLAPVRWIVRTARRIRWAFSDGGRRA